MSNNITSPSPSLSLPDLIAYYETCNRAEGKSPKTIKWYSDNLKRFQKQSNGTLITSSVFITTSRVDTFQIL
jgi:hypothetical protein